VAAWGDSLTAAAYPRILTELSGMRVENGGVNGQTSSQIAARMLSATNLHRCPTLLWVGRNNYDQPQTVIRDLESMVEALNRAGNFDRFLVLGVINSSYGGYENRDTAPHRSILELNRQLQQRYGDRFVPVREMLIDAYNPQEPGDVMDHSNDVPPRSLRSDELHLNEAGYRLLVEYLLRNKMIRLRGDWGWDERVSLQNRDGLWTVKAEVRLGWRYQLESSTGLLQWEDESEPIGPAVRIAEWEKPLYPTAQRFFRLRRLPD
jgi:lysophospholipase L1-like esterase